MFGKPLFTRPAAASSPAPQFQPGPHTQTASKRPSSLFKKLRHVKNVFRRPSSTKKDAISQGTSQRQQGVPASPQPSHEGLAALAYDDGAGLYRRPHLHAPVAPTQSSASLNLSPRFQTGSQGSTSSAAHRSNFYANAALLLAPPQPVAATPDITFARTRLPPHCSPQTAALRSTTSLNASSPLALPRSVATTPAITFAPARSSLQSSTQSSTVRSPFAPKVSSPLAAPPSVATTPAASFAPARSPSHWSTLSTSPPSTYASSTLQLPTPPESVATTPATDSSPTFTSFQCSKPGYYFSPTNPLMADLEETAALLGHQYNRRVRGVHPMIQDQGIPYTKPAVDKGRSAKKELREVIEQAAAADRECSKLEALLRGECENFDEEEAASLDAFSSLTPTTTFAPARSPFQRSTQSTTFRSPLAPRVSSPLAAPPSVATTPAASFAPARSPSHCSTVSTTPPSTYASSTLQLPTPPESVATTPITDFSPTFTSFQCSKPGDYFSPTNSLIADLEETAAFLGHQNNHYVGGVHSMIQDPVFSYTKSTVDETESAKKELKEVIEQAAAVDMECSKLEALLREESENFEEAEAALKRPKWHREGADDEHAVRQAKVHQLQAGQAVNGVWRHRASEPLQQDSMPSKPVAEQEEAARDASPVAANWSQRAKKVVKSWGSRWKSLIALERSSVPHAAQTVTKLEQRDSRSDSDEGQGAESAALDPSPWMKGSLRGGPSKNGPGASSLQDRIAAYRGSGQQI